MVRTSPAVLGCEVPRYLSSYLGLSLYCSIGVALEARPTHGRSQWVWGAGLMRQNGRGGQWSRQVCPRMHLVVALAGNLPLPLWLPGDTRQHHYSQLYLGDACWKGV